MSAFRQVLVSSLVFALIPTALLSGASTSVQYVGGTVQSIPVNSVGSLRLDDAKELRFNYNGAVFRLPYDQITSTELANVPMRRVLGKIPVPSMKPSHWKKSLSISYKDAAGAAGTVRFELPVTEATSASDTIEDRRIPQNASAQPEWWGDPVWKTKRNRASWEAGNTQASQPAPAAPAGNQ